MAGGLLPGRTVEEKLRLNVRYERRTRCWIWTATATGNGYGSIWLNGKSAPVHRVAYELWVGKLEITDTVDHVRPRCSGNILCINPAHLEAVSGPENTARAAEAARINAQRWREQLDPRSVCGVERVPGGKVSCDMPPGHLKKNGHSRRHADAMAHTGTGPSGRRFYWRD